MIKILKALVIMFLISCKSGVENGSLSQAQVGFPQAKLVKKINDDVCPQILKLTPSSCSTEYFLKAFDTIVVKNLEFPSQELAQLASQSIKQNKSQKSFTSKNSVYLIEGLNGFFISPKALKTYQTQLSISPYEDFIGYIEPSYLKDIRSQTIVQSPFHQNFELINRIDFDFGGVIYLTKTSIEKSLIQPISIQGLKLVQIETEGLFVEIEVEGFVFLVGGGTNPQNVVKFAKNVIPRLRNP